MKHDARYTSLNIITAAFLFLLGFLAIVFSNAIELWDAVLGQIAVAFLIGLGGFQFSRNRRGFRPAMVRAASILVIYAIAFSAVAPLQHLVFDRWFDSILVSLDKMVFGMELSLYFQAWIHPFVTEWMMFSYVVYVPLLPLTAYLSYKGAGDEAVHDYLINLSIAYIICYLGFIAFPVATQLHFVPELYTVPLDGWFFASLGEWMRNNLHAPGEALPSPHCAAATVMLVMFYRYQKKLFPWLLPIIITLYFSTVYGRYHYSWDAISGIVTGFAVLHFSPYIVVSMKKAFPRFYTGGMTGV